MLVDDAIDLIRQEYEKAGIKFSRFNSCHEGYAIIKEEIDELWERIKEKDKDWDEIQKEIKQVGAMALRFMVDLCGKGIEKK